MSKYNNVNPGQYKVSGRERPNTVAEERMKVTRAAAGKSTKRKKASTGRSRPR